MSTLGPRLVVAGTASGVGKTTVATGLMAALRRRGVKVAAAKVGPDFIDPGYHALATGRPGRNLDVWLSGEELMAPLAARAGSDAEVLVVEGVMGLFDGAGATAEASTAHVATLLGAPVVLVVDGSAMSGSVAAMVHGYATFDPDVHVAGVVLNRVGSEGHETLLREALEPTAIPVLGALRRDDDLSWRDRHLGLVPVAEQPERATARLDRLASAVADAVDLEGVMKVALAAERRHSEQPPAARRVADVRVAVAGGRPFSFMYPDNLELLQQAGAELVPFDPINDSRLPEGARALVAGGGFPEVFATALADNRHLLDDVRARVAAGLVTWAECGGLLWLARTLEGRRLCGVIDAEARMTDRLTLGYRTATARRDTPLAGAGTTLRGHEFHYSIIEPGGDALELVGRFGRGQAGWASPTMLASYLHLHLAATPEMAERFVLAAAR